MGRRGLLVGGYGDEFEKEKIFRGFAKGEVVNLDQVIGKGGGVQGIVYRVFFSPFNKKKQLQKLQVRKQERKEISLLYKLMISIIPIYSTTHNSPDNPMYQLLSSIKLS